jgi:hypothetical protein
VGARYGSTLSGYLTVRGFVTPVCWTTPSTKALRFPSGPDFMSLIDSQWEVPELPISVYPDYMDGDAQLRDSEEHIVHLLALVATDCMTLTNVIVLILREQSDGMYSRLGCLDTLSRHDVEGNLVMTDFLLKRGEKVLTLI